ncbi:alpha/beta hydrolase [Fontimonas sp. SYSU GA230001]|uniref:alpha/beta fold hydrolase n=1 Tax=Fontimonas sp. SYSU GA230001 TaxID=3142450 RepID=UPI0032B5C2F6
MRTVIRLLALAVPAVLLSGCITIGDARKPITGIFVAAPQPEAERTLVVVLPGFGNAAEDMRQQGIAEAVHRHWPEADVLLTNATFAYYKERNIVERLQADVIAPARAQGYRQVWLAGASIGGMGVLFYEYAHPGAADGLVLLAPWAGDRKLIDEIAAAGGIAQWQPGEVPAAIDADNYQREMWRVVKRWSEDEQRRQQVWLICGDHDRLLQTSRLIAPALPDSHYIEIPGAHDWKTFLAATERVIGAIRGRRAIAQAAADRGY